MATVIMTLSHHTYWYYYLIHCYYFIFILTGLMAVAILSLILSPILSSSG